LDFAAGDVFDEVGSWVAVFTLASQGESDARFGKTLRLVQVLVQPQVSFLDWEVFQVDLPLSNRVLVDYNQEELSEGSKVSLEGNLCVAFFGELWLEVEQLNRWALEEVFKFTSFRPSGPHV